MRKGSYILFNQKDYEDDRTDLDTRITKNTNDIKTINETTIPGLDERITANKTSIDTINNTTIPALDERITTNTNNITKNTNDIKTINETTIPGLDERITANKTSIDTINNTTIPALDERITTNTNNITKNTNDIKTINETTIPGLDERITTNTTNITNNTTEITSLDNRVTSLEDTPSVSFPYLKPEDFGAVGDGVTDDTNAFDSCLSQAVDSLKPILLSGKYLISSYLTVGNTDDPIILMGINKTKVEINFTATASNYGLFSLSRSTKYPSRLYVSNITFNGSGTDFINTENYSGVRHEVHINNCIFNNFSTIIKGYTDTQTYKDVDINNADSICNKNVNMCSLDNVYFKNQNESDSHIIATQGYLSIINSVFESNINNILFSVSSGEKYTFFRGNIINNIKNTVMETYDNVLIMNCEFNESKDTNNNILFTYTNDSNNILLINNKINNNQNTIVFKCRKTKPSLNFSYGNVLNINNTYSYYNVDETDSNIPIININSYTNNNKLVAWQPKIEYYEHPNSQTGGYYYKMIDDETIDIFFEFNETISGLTNLYKLINVVKPLLAEHYTDYEVFETYADRSTLTSSDALRQYIIGVNFINLTTSLTVNLWLKTITPNDSAVEPDFNFKTFIHVIMKKKESSSS